jgi:hypothetical protein
MERSADRWRRELLEAGWKQYKGMVTVWESPTGALYRGPYGAWVAMAALRPTNRRTSDATSDEEK